MRTHEDILLMPDVDRRFIICYITNYESTKKALQKAIP